MSFKQSGNETYEKAKGPQIMFGAESAESIPTCFLALTTVLVLPRNKIFLNYFIGFKFKA